MARIYKGSSYTLQLLIAKSTSSPIENVRFDFFTIDPQVTVLVEDGITIDGNLAKVKIGETQFDTLADGLITYVVYGTRDGMTYMEERQSNYYLKTPEGEKPVIPDINNYYTKEETDNAIDQAITANNTHIEELGYATQDWVNEKNYAPKSYVDNAIDNVSVDGLTMRALKERMTAIEVRTDWLEEYGRQYIMVADLTLEGLANIHMDKGSTIKDLKTDVRNNKRPDIYLRINNIEIQPLTIMRDTSTTATITLVFLMGSTLYNIEITSDNQINSTKIDLI